MDRLAETDVEKICF